MAQPRTRTKRGNKKYGHRLGPDTWERDGQPHYAALLIKRLDYDEKERIGEPFTIAPVLASSTDTAVAAFNANPTHNGNGAQRAITVIPLFTNMSGGSGDHPMRVTAQRAFHYVHEHVGEDGENDLDDPAMLQIVFQAIEQGMVRAYMVGLAEGTRRQSVRTAISRKGPEGG